MIKTDIPTPPLPPPPPNPPQFGSQATRASAQRQSQSLIGSLGGTVATGPGGDLSTPRVSRKTLIGE
jgi:hypothetical protein